MTNIIISSLHYYPIKSCAGITTDQAVLTPRGFAHDRMFMIVDVEGLFLSQREHPKLALVQPEVVDPLFRLNGPGMAEVAFEILTDGPTNTGVVWRDRCQAIDQGDEAAAWLTRYLGQNVRLVRMADNFNRPVESGYEVNAADPVSFADGFPFLLTAESSLADLNSRLADSLPMNRFRPNIVIQGSEAYAEDGWKEIQIGDVPFAVVKPCARCAITTIDQTTGEQGTEPLTTLANHRVLPGWQGVMFGQNLIPLGEGEIKVGDSVQLIGCWLIKAEITMLTVSASSANSKTVSAKMQIVKRSRNLGAFLMRKY